MDDQIKERVLEIVAEKTGYPKDMLDLDLDLEADLGIDTVKQAEMFASVRAEYQIPRDETMKLRDFPTLAHVIKFARDRRAGSGGCACSQHSCCARNTGTESGRAGGPAFFGSGHGSAANPRQFGCCQQHPTPRAGA